MLSRRWTLLIGVFALAFSLTLAACGGEDEEPTDTGSDTAGEAGEVVGEATDETGEATDEASGTTSEVAGDPEAGALAFNEQGCSGCHNVDSDASMTGPSLQNIGNVAEERTDQSAPDYLRESITNPNVYVVEGYPEDVMPAYDLPDDQLDNLVAYLLTLHQ